MYNISNLHVKEETIFKRSFLNARGILYFSNFTSVRFISYRIRISLKFPNAKPIRKTSDLLEFRVSKGRKECDRTLLYYSTSVNFTVDPFLLRIPIIFLSSFACLPKVDPKKTRKSWIKESQPWETNEKKKKWLLSASKNQILNVRSFSFFQWYWTSS